MTTYTSTYSPEDNKLRLYATSRLDADTYAIVKAHGFTWAPKQDLFVAPAWSPEREDLLLELCDSIDDEDTSLVDRAEARAERFDDYSEARTADATQAHASVEHLMDGIPLGQPILVGHHSEKRARKDAERIEHGMRKAVNMWATAQYWQDRAHGAMQHAKYKALPAVRARRIKTLEADLRKEERTENQASAFDQAWREQSLTHQMALNIANHDHVSQCYRLADYPREAPASQYEGPISLWSALTDDVITFEQARDIALPAHKRTMAHCERWITHLNNRLAYERAMLDDSGGTEADQTKPEVGGACRCWVSRNGAWSYIVKVNKVSVSLLDNWRNGGHNFPRVIPFDKLQSVLPKAQVDTLRAQGRIVEHDDKTGFYRLDTPVTPRADAPAPEAPPFDVDALKDTLKAGIHVHTVPQLFPTPPDLATRMVALADIQPGDRVLEPSAGTGNLLIALHARRPRYLMGCHTTAVEINEHLTRGLAPHANTVVNNDFLLLDPALREPFDVVLMNPPFHAGADVAHVTHALQFLRPGGRLVAVMSASVTFNQTRAYETFRQLVAQHNGTITPLPDDTFADEGTHVRTVLVQITTPEAPKAPTLADLAATIATHGKATQTQLTRARLEADWKTKTQPTKAQAPPCGLFAQTQADFLA